MTAATRSDPPRPRHLMTTSMHRGTPEPCGNGLPPRSHLVFIHSTLDDLGLKPAVFRVYCHLARRANAGGALDGVAWPAVAGMAEVCRLHPQTVRQALRSLTSLRMITATVRSGRTTEYRLAHPSRWLRPAPVNSSTSPSASQGTPSVPVSAPPSEMDVSEGIPMKGNPPKTHPQTIDPIPSLEEMEAFAATEGIALEAATKFYLQSQASGWIGRNGQRIRHWRPALLAYWRSWQALDDRGASRFRGRVRAVGATAPIPPASAFTSTKI